MHLTYLILHHCNKCMLSSTCVDAYGRIGGALVCGLHSRFHSDGAWGLFGPTSILIDIHGASGHSLGMFENMTTRSASNTIVQAKHIHIYIYMSEISFILSRKLLIYYIFRDFPIISANFNNFLQNPTNLC